MTSLENQCTRAGLKMTGQRRVILQVLDESEDHPSVEEVYERAKAKDSSISMATVYRTMGMLDELGLVVRHDFKENFARYELLDDNHHHHHLIDIDSGEVIEFNDPRLDALEKELAEKYGYELVDHRFELYGRKTRK